MRPPGSRHAEVGEHDVLEVDVLDLPAGVVDVAVCAHEQDGLAGVWRACTTLVHARHGRRRRQGVRRAAGVTRRSRRSGRSAGRRPPRGRRGDRRRARGRRGDATTAPPSARARPRPPSAPAGTPAGRAGPARRRARRAPAAPAAWRARARARPGPAGRPRARRPGGRARARARSRSRASASSQRGFSLRPSVSISLRRKRRYSGWSWATNPTRGSTRVGVRAAMRRARRAAVRRRGESDDEVQQRRLARAVGADQRRHRARRDLERAIVQRPACARSACRAGRRDAASCGRLPKVSASRRRTARRRRPRRSPPSAPAGSSAPAPRSADRSGGAAASARRDERALPAPALDEPLVVQLAVGLEHRVGVDRERPTTSLTVGSWSPGWSIPRRTACLTCWTSCR